MECTQGKRKELPISVCEVTPGGDFEMKVQKGLVAYGPGREESVELHCKPEGKLWLQGSGCRFKFLAAIWSTAHW